jgi:ABC-type multidrug transport system permease subunit
MLHAALLVFQNEFRLLSKDRAAVFMLVLAPIVIIAVAGFSLGNIYGVRAGAEPYKIVVVDNDHGEIARAFVDALHREPSVSVIETADLDAARAIVKSRNRAPLAIVIPAGTSGEFEAGRNPQLALYVDPVKRLEAQALELRLARLCIGVMAAVRARANVRIAAQSADLRSRLAAISARMQATESRVAQVRVQFERARAQAASELNEHLRDSIEQARAQTIAAVNRSIADARVTLERDLTGRRAALAAVSNYVAQLQASRDQFDQWLSGVKAAAGSHAAQIPAPPRWPTPPSAAQLAVLREPIALPSPGSIALQSAAAPEVGIKLPEMPEIPAFAPPSRNDLAAAAGTVSIPGSLGWRERSIGGGAVRVNTFDQYVPGFGITFLLVDMLWGVGVGLIDERDWGTLARLRVSGAPPAGMMVGKLMARFVIGVGQMIVLFAAGWALFGITLGHSWWALLVPAAAISFAAAAFSLVIACVANTRDAVLPIGAMAALAMSAIGGCWWPLDFEPHWMRTVALAMPTTWTIQAFNNLMIRGLGPDSIVVPALITFALGVVFLGWGILGSSRIYE